MNSISLKSIQNIVVYATAITFSMFSFAENNNKKVDEYLDRIERLLQYIPEETIHQERILQGKRLIMRDILEAIERKDAQQTQKVQEIKKEADPEAHFYKPKHPNPLSEEEKKENIKKRIEKKYIGKLPGQIDDLIEFYSNYEFWKNNRVAITNRALLCGEPGLGKNYLVKVLSEELEIPVLSFNSSFFGNKYIGESSRRIRRVFEVAKKFNKPMFIFIDEIDGIAKARSDNMHNEHRATLITLLTELEDLRDYRNVFVFVATNDIKSIDKAIKSRFAGSIIEFDYLNKDERVKLFKKLYADKGDPLTNEFAQRLAELTEPYYEGYSRIKFSNRDIQYIVDNSLVKFDCARSKNDPNFDRRLCKYVRQAMGQGKYLVKFGCERPPQKKQENGWWPFTSTEKTVDDDPKNYEKYCDGI